ncbi:unnamed protein product [Orchesella dallaii]|uniref:Uncharacterized protein n=1 Tax=Orchesella dallaii TaxID=48710 RepID=A0ABP1Q1U1_9HEXA
MHGFTIVLLVTLLAQKIVSALEIPTWLLESSCTINIVSSPSNSSPTDSLFTQFYLHSVSKHFSLTYTSYQVGELNFALKNSENYDDINGENEDLVTINHGYLRFSLRYQNNFNVFLLLTPNLNETLISIENSGYATSEHAMFIIPREDLTTYEELIESFNQSTTLFENTEAPFHADILFYYPNLTLIFCLFCPNKLNKIENVSMPLIKAKAKELTRNGHGNILAFPMPLGTPSSAGPRVNKCLKIHFKRDLKDSVLSLSIKCTDSQLFSLGLLQPILNISIDISGRGVSESHQNWFLNVRQEGFLLPNDNVYLQTRGWIVLVEGLNLDVFVCQDKNNLLVFDFKLTSRIDNYVQILCILIFFMYLFLYKNVCKAIDMIGALFGKPFLFKHPRKCIFVYLIACLFFSCNYQSNVSSESVRMLEFGSFQQFQKAGYKFVQKNYKQVIRILNAAPEVTKQRINKFFGPPEQAFVKLFGELREPGFFGNWRKVINAATKYKLFIPSFLKLGQFLAVKADVMYVEEEILCKIFHLTKLSPLPLEFSFRSWSYMSARFNEVFGQLIESGIYGEIRNLAFNSRSGQLGDLDVRAPSSTVVAKPLDIHSNLGTSPYKKTKKIIETI